MLPDIAKGQDGRVSEQLCAAAVELANALDASAIFVYTRRGYMANFLSRCRPDAPIFAFTGQPPQPGLMLQMLVSKARHQACMCNHLHDPPVEA